MIAIQHRGNYGEFAVTNDVEALTWLRSDPKRPQWVSLVL